MKPNIKQQKQDLEIIELFGRIIQIIDMIERFRKHDYRTPQINKIEENVIFDINFQTCQAELALKLLIEKDDYNSKISN